MSVSSAPSKPVCNNSDPLPINPAVVVQVVKFRRRALKVIPKGSTSEEEAQSSPNSPSGCVKQSCSSKDNKQSMTKM